MLLLTSSTDNAYRRSRCCLLRAFPSVYDVSSELLFSSCTPKCKHMMFRGCVWGRIFWVLVQLAAHVVTRARAAIEETRDTWRIETRTRLQTHSHTQTNTRTDFHAPKNGIQQIVVKDIVDAGVARAVFDGCHRGLSPGHSRGLNFPDTGGVNVQSSAHHQEHTCAHWHTRCRPLGVGGEGSL